MKKRFYGSVLALVACIVFVLVACGKHSEPTGPDIPTNPIAAVPGNTAASQPIAGSGLCAGKDSWTAADKSLTFCVLETNLNLLDNRCQIVERSTNYFVKVGIVSATGGYFRVAGFHSPENSCGATGDGSSHDPNDQKTFAGSTNGVTSILQWDVNGEACGREQHDIKVKNATSEADFPFGIVFNYARACPTCAAAKIKLNERKTGARSYELKPTWSNGGSATLEWGDGTPIINGVRSGDTFTHTYGGNGPYIINLVIHQGNLECPDPITVRFDPDPTPTPTPTPRPSPTPTPSPSPTPTPRPSPTPTPSPSPTPTPPPTCDNYQKPTITGEPNASQSATQVTVTSGNVGPSGGSFNPSLPLVVNRPPYGSSAGSWQTTYTLGYGPQGLHCTVRRDFSGRVPPQDCQKVNQWTLHNNRGDGVYTIVVSTSQSNPAGSVVQSFNLSGGQSASFTGYNNQTLYAFFKLPNGHGGFDYHLADSETSGACGSSGASAQWQGDATLSVTCTCPH